MPSNPLSHYFPRIFHLASLRPPRDFYPIAGTPICLEIGAGKGKHALLFAHQNPDKHLYAIERTAIKFGAFDKQAGIANPPNLTAIHADAIAWTAFAVYPKQLQTCFILYPNPEPKNKNQRFLNMPFFELLLSKMADGGQIILASNISDYIDEAERLLNEIWQLPYVKRQIEPISARTHFEIKYLARGERCQELIITKPGGYRTRFDETLPLHLSWSPSDEA
ncbi:tRNA (guanine-N(7)-)-methyltransferase [Moraxella bovis]|uniref:tRNA (guanine-N(7)-)-methyltransferase n=1 Tax=Moraxella bovis TaxID=476 RepID=UPI0022265A1C|nr:tRNA (guanine-N(7)-)-methyltransferase [Moraxella bovis]UYZ69559.1 tRNA (guanine-N(7)-)-methyltransferase [Moraxella bovis]